VVVATASALPPLKLILMSATLQIDEFAAYFGGKGLAVEAITVAGAVLSF
jgi:HrpA-like RNA helicase